MWTLFQIRYEQVELRVILCALFVAGTLSWQLYSSMVDGWQLHAHTRWHILTLSGSLLVLSIVACIYVCQRLQTTVRLQSSCPVSVRDKSTVFVYRNFSKIDFYSTGTAVLTWWIEPQSTSSLQNQLRWAGLRSVHTW